MEEPAPKSPSPNREVPSSTFVDSQQEQEQEPKPQQPLRQAKESVQSPEDNRVSSMSDETPVVEQEHPALKDVVGLFRFDNRSFKILVLKVVIACLAITFGLLVCRIYLGFP